MNSSFTSFGASIILIFSLIMFLKMLAQFRFPDHPLKLTSYLVVLALITYFSMNSVVFINKIPSTQFEKIIFLPLIIFSTGLLVQLISVLGNLSFFQQKIFTRIPVLFGLISYPLDLGISQILFFLSFLLGIVCMFFFPERGRYQKRVYFKCVLFLALFYLFSINQGSFGNFSFVFLFFSLTYFFKFQNAVCIQALIQKEASK